MLDQIEAVHIRLYESTDGDDPVSQWSAEGSFDEAVSRPRVVRDGRFHLAKRFSERERFRFPPPIGEVSVVLAAQDEVGTLPHSIPLKQMDVKIGGNEIDRLRRWHRQGQAASLARAGGGAISAHPDAPPGGPPHPPRAAAKCAFCGRGDRARHVRKEQPLEIRWDVTFPTLYQIRMRGLGVTPVTYATAQMAALFVRHFPREPARRLCAGIPAGRSPPGRAPNGARARGFRITMKIRPGKPPLDEDEW